MTGEPAAAGAVRARRVTRFALLLAVAAILHTVEGAFPPPLPLPGARLGLANIVSLLVLVTAGLRPALLLTLTRTILGAVLQGSLLGFGFLLSFGAGMASTLAMGMLYHGFGRRFSLVGVSLFGALTHNVTQLALAAAIVGSVGIVAYLPYMLLGSLPTGLMTGLAATAALNARQGMLREWITGA